jgi:hypothetical protein
MFSVCATLALKNATTIRLAKMNMAKMNMAVHGLEDDIQKASPTTKPPTNWWARQTSLAGYRHCVQVQERYHIKNTYRQSDQSNR